jgi:dTMP kinase
MTAVFITFEGGEGGGKSTQSKLLADRLESAGMDVLHTREPGGTTGAEQIRELLVKGEASRWDAMTEILLHMAARRDHVEKCILPALAAGKIVICDRFMDSTIAYQGYGHGISVDIIRQMHALAIGALQPDITFILDIAPEEGIARANRRNDGNNRYEAMQLAFHQRLREGFRAIAAAQPQRCVVLDATENLQEIHSQILSELKQRTKINC